MRYLWDSSACIQHLRGRDQRLTQRLAASAAGDVVICSIVRAELRYGAQKHPRAQAEFVRLDRFLTALESLPFDDRAADHAAQIRHALGMRGTPIGPNDLLIAAIARANTLTLVTGNAREFALVPELLVEDWGSPRA